MSDLKVHKDGYPKGYDHDGVLEGFDAIERTAETPFVPRRRRGAVDEEALNAEAIGDGDKPHRFALTPVGRAAIEEDSADFVAEVKATNRELLEQLKGYERANAGLREQNAQLVCAHAEKLEANLHLEIRLARLTEDGVPAPASLDQAIAQLFDAEAVFAGAERRARSARGLKFDAQAMRDRAEAAAIVRLVGEGGKRGEVPRPGAMSPTEAKDRLEEDSEYAQLAGKYRDAARTSDDCETELRIATSRVWTLRECVHAMAHRSPLTARAVAISHSSRTQQ